ncbi:C-C motif chemokine 27b [Astyanax mexicanus]|uniref:C-C motif chemokine 27-like n=1 Tax=Astyanax mexicanus TaxID=7994 RepID=A0A8T2KYU2_ASTMX|nr:C-C motif chemokine 27b [Astyanax mexicanus]KAG9263025.1 C-C motif chemokine 27-like [Astyanax mexicanus]
MDLRVLLLLLTFTFTFTCIQGAVPKCCVQTSRIPLSILQEVEKVEVQSRHGACEIDALVLHHNGKKYCAKPRAKKVLETLRHIKLGTQHMA